MSTIFRGSAETEPAPRAHEQQLADDPFLPASTALTAAQLRRLCLDAGADDVGFVEIERPALGSQRETAEKLLPGARTVVSLVIATNRENLLAPPRSIASDASHHDGERLATVVYNIARSLHGSGVRAVVTSVGFPMETGRWISGSSRRSPTRPWPSRPASVTWASTATSSTPGSGTSYCWTRS